MVVVQVGWLGAAMGRETALVEVPVGGGVGCVCVFVDSEDTGVGVDGMRNRLTGIFSAGRPSVVSRTWQVMGGRVGCAIVRSVGLMVLTLMVGGVGAGEVVVGAVGAGGVAAGGVGVDVACVACVECVADVVVCGLLVLGGVGDRRRRLICCGSGDSAEQRSHGGTLGEPAWSLERLEEDVRGGVGRCRC